MGFGDPALMRAGLEATRAASASTVGTLTVDSYTRLGQEDAVRTALDQGHRLNGYPLTVHPAEVTRSLLAGLSGSDFPVQVRHGSARPQRIVAALIRAGLDATEGGPISYCLPYGRTPLAEAVDNWRRSCELLAGHAARPHLETFGGCLLGQLCPPGLLVAVSLLEALFFQHHGVLGVSLSYAQQTAPAQDEDAVRALRSLAREFLAGDDWHVVLYTYMGLYPRSPAGAERLLAESARLAVRAGAARLIVKTSAEAHRIPTVAENVRALELAAAAGAAASRSAGVVTDGTGGGDSEVYREARSIVSAVLGLHPDPGTAILRAFARGLLDIPYCLHPDNAGRSRSGIDPAGRLVWVDPGAVPVGRPVTGRAAVAITARKLLRDLSYVRDRFDGPPAGARLVGTAPA